MVHPIAQAVGVRLIYLTDSHIDIEAFVYLLFLFLRLEDDAHGKDIINLVERHLLLLHLVPYRIRALHTCLYLILEPHLVECLPYGSRELFEKFITGFLRTCKFLFYDGILFRVFKLETQVFEFRLDIVQTKTVCQWSIDIQGLSGNFISFVWRLPVKGTHVMKTVTYFDKDNANVITHHQQ